MMGHRIAIDGGEHASICAFCRRHLGFGRGERRYAKRKIRRRERRQARVEIRLLA